MTRQFSSFQTIHISPGSFISKQMMQISLCLVLIAVRACNSTIDIIGGDTFYFENTEKLSIKCTNDVESIVEFKKSDSLLASCVLSSTCSVNDPRFTVVSNVSEWQYLLESNSSFSTDLCGSYACVDVLNGRNDTFDVFLKDFDNNSYFAEEKGDKLSISTACVFPANLEITWYTFYNGSLEQMSDANLDAFNSVPSNTTCPNVTCGISQAHSFTFGLDSLNGTGLSLSFVEVEIVHPMFKDKPLIWRSSKQYPVVMVKSAPDETGNPVWPIPVGVIGGLGIVSLSLFAVYKYRKHKKKQDAEKIQREREREKERERARDMETAMIMKKRRKLVAQLPLFSSFDNEEKSDIADRMIIKHISYNGEGMETVNMQGKLHVIVAGALHVKLRKKTFGWSCGFVKPFEFTMLPTLADIVNEDSHKWSGDAKIAIHKISFETEVLTTKSVEFLVMDHYNYTDFLTKNKKWQSVLKDEEPKHLKGRETCVAAQTIAAWQPVGVPEDDKNDFPIPTSIPMRISVLNGRALPAIPKVRGTNDQVEGTRESSPTDDKFALIIIEVTERYTYQEDTTSKGKKSNLAGNHERL